MKIRFVIVFAALAMLAVAAGCGPSPAATAVPTAGAYPVSGATPVGQVPPVPTAAIATSSTSGFPVSIVDDAKRTVRLDRAPQKIISLAPSNTEILFALGLGSRVVGVTDFCDYPAEAKAVAKIGGVKPSLEKIVSLSPDLILAIGGNAELVTRLEELKLVVAVLDPKDVAGVLKDIDLVGRATGATAESAKLGADMKARMDAVTAKAQTAARPRVFYELDATDPAKPYTAGPGSWHDQLIGLAGGSNVAASAKSQWVQFSLEELLKADPQVVLLGDAAFGATVEAVKKRTGWADLSASKAGAVFAIDDNLISRPGPRLAAGLETLAKLIHPELFK